MSGQVWVSLISLGGVALGGVLSFLVQFATQRSAERTEQRRQQTELSEARRAERLALLERFVEVGAEAERAAFSRPHEWDDTSAWFLTTQDAMNRLWVAERLIRIQFPFLCMTQHASTSSTSTGPCGTACPTARACVTTWKTTGWPFSTQPEQSWDSPLRTPKFLYGTPQ